mmetsp:Transcript_53/g.56  ORF Transcript_53/g.56 Transcript_53/m.56 type:complete len:84 (+) Transcript_53:992-1243(+)
MLIILRRRTPIISWLRLELTTLVLGARGLSDFTDEGFDLHFIVLEEFFLPFLGERVGIGQVQALGFRSLVLSYTFLFRSKLHF